MKRERDMHGQLDRNLLERAAQQGLGHIGVRSRCYNCNYIAETDDEEDRLAKTNLSCPNCGLAGRGAGLAPSKYLDVANWIGQYAKTEYRRDHVSAVVLFCALTESILETLKDDYLGIHPKKKNKLKKKLESNKGPDFKDVFNNTLSDLLKTAPPNLRDFPSRWKDLREKRNKFLHAKSSSYLIHKTDADEAIVLTLMVFHVYTWLNNNYCLKSQFS